MTNDKVFKLLGLFFVALLLFNFPILSLFSEGRPMGGATVIFTYIFLTWGAIILFTALIVESNQNNKPR
ncbi:MAG: hypothetical protein KDD19_03460 [Phaeodactylibacter sp.]|nr:hypothetical protein [Phaeodactylibacter sp.]